MLTKNRNKKKATHVLTNDSLNMKFNNLKIRFTLFQHNIEWKN